LSETIFFCKISGVIDVLSMDDVTTEALAEYTGALFTKKMNQKIPIR
jgi:hypothetical protein